MTTNDPRLEHLADELRVAYFQKLRSEIAALKRRVLEWQAETTREYGRAEILRQDLILALQERDVYVDKYREAAGLPAMVHTGTTTEGDDHATP